MWVQIPPPAQSHVGSTPYSSTTMIPEQLNQKNLKLSQIKTEIRKMMTSMGGNLTETLIAITKDQEEIKQMITHLATIGPQEVLEKVLHNVPKKRIRKIAQRANRVTHGAWMVSTPPALFVACAAKQGLTEGVAVFPSSIVAKILGAPTTIIKVEGQIDTPAGSKQIGIEVFRPEASLEQIQQWQKEGTVNHYALQAKSVGDVDLLRQELVELGLTDVLGRVKTNPDEGSWVAYLDGQTNERSKMRLEIFYQEK